MRTFGLRERSCVIDALGEAFVDESRAAFLAAVKVQESQLRESLTMMALFSKCPGCLRDVTHVAYVSGAWTGRCIECVKSISENSYQLLHTTAHPEAPSR